MIQRYIRDKDLILIPVHRRVHWYLVTVQHITGNTMLLSLYDAMYDRRFEDTLEQVERLIVETCQDSTECEKTFQRAFPRIPTQRNGHDCGVFLCQIAKAVAFGHSLAFEEKDMKQLRDQMKGELIRLAVETEPFTREASHSSNGAQRLSTKKQKHELLSFRNPGDRCWLNSSLQLVVTAMKVRHFAPQTELGCILHNYLQNRYDLL